MAIMMHIDKKGGEGRMISFWIGFIGAIIGVVGWFGFGSIWALVIGFAAYIIETIMERKELNRNAKLLDIVILAIGCIVGLFVKSVPFYVMGLIFINIYSLLMGLLGLPAAFRKY